jgi:cobalt-zinc-cadmium efflux system outer membrane protein
MPLRGFSLVLSLTALIALPLPAVGEESLTLSSAIESAVQSNRELAAARFIIDEAKGRFVQAGLWPNPEFELSTASDWAFGREGESVVEVGFIQRLPVSGRIARAKRVAKADVELAELEVEDQERLLAGEVSRRFRELLVARHRLGFFQDLSTAIEESLRVTERRFAVAEVSEADVNLQKLEFERLRIESGALEVENQRLSSELNSLLGREPVEELNLRGNLDPNVPESRIRQAKEEALERRPDRRLALSRIERAKKEIALAKAERFEDWTLGIGYSREKSPFDEPGLEDVDDLVGLRLGVPLPLWNRNQGRILEARAGKGRARAVLDALDLKIRTEIEVAEKRIRGLRPILARYETTSLPTAEKNVRLLRQSYAEGLTDISSVLQAQRQLVELRMGYLDSLLEFEAAFTDFETATASPNLLEGGLKR